MTVCTADIEAHAARMRVNIIKMLAEAGSGHPGGSLSAADIVAALYFGGVMNVNPSDPAAPDRDRFILCKGHAAPVLYAALAEVGYIPEEELLTLRKLNSRLQGHPDSRKLPGVEVSTGSLGQGLSIAAGLALGLKLNARCDGSTEPQAVFALLGDGEIQEGQVWEAALFAPHYQLDNLIAIVDNNNLQIDGDVREVIGLTDIAAKFRAFGWETAEVDGHSVPALLDVLAVAKQAHTPMCIVAHTVKGKGVSFMENQAGWHGKAPNAEQAAQALAELRGEE